MSCVVRYPFSPASVRSWRILMSMLFDDKSVFAAAFFWEGLGSAFFTGTVFGAGAASFGEVFVFATVLGRTCGFAVFTAFCLGAAWAFAAFGEVFVCAIAVLGDLGFACAAFVFAGAFFGSAFFAAVFTDAETAFLGFAAALLTGGFFVVVFDCAILA